MATDRAPARKREAGAGYAWDLHLPRGAEVRITFPEEGTFPYRAKTSQNELLGTITVDDQSFSSGVHVVVITDSVLEPRNATINSRHSVVWKNRSSEAVTVVSVPGNSGTHSRHAELARAQEEHRARTARAAAQARPGLAQSGPVAPQTKSPGLSKTDLESLERLLPRRRSNPLGLSK